MTQLQIENNRIRIGQRIIELREAKGLTQGELAAATGYLQTNISRIEKGKVNVSLDILARIIEVLGGSVEII